MTTARKMRAVVFFTVLKEEGRNETIIETYGLPWQL